jgi:uncharacterized protein YigE (DUF2233 family)
MNAGISRLSFALAVSASIGLAGLPVTGPGSASLALAQSGPQSKPDREATPDLAGLLAALAAMQKTEPLPGLSVGEAIDPAFGIRILVVDFDQARFGLRVVEQRTATGSHAADFLETADDVFVINGGFFEKSSGNQLSPSGLLIAGGAVVAEEHPRAGSGILYSDGARVGIAPRNALANRSALREAIQVGPLLVDPGGVKGIYKDDVERHDRSAICLRGEVFTAIAVEGGMSLFQLADLLSLPAADGGFGCDVAINLDGGPSTQALLRAGQERRDIAGASPVQNAIVVFPRGTR